jgi:transcriptional regulator with XRE-family HTH domain
MSPAPKAPDESTYSGRFAARLRSLREKTGLSAEAFADAIISEGHVITSRTYYRWESGQSEPPLNVYPVLAKLLKLKSARMLLPID